MKRKYICKRLIVCILVFLTLFNFIISPLGRIDEVWATTEEVTDFENVAESMISARNNGIAGILSWLIRVVVIGIFGTIQIGEFLIADSAGNDGSVSSIFVTPFDIFFNRFTLTDINIFTTEGLEPGGLVYSIRVNASLWYNIFRAVAVALLLVMLLIIGIKMAFATLAEQKAKVKQLFMDWVVSLALVMFMSLIVVLIVNVNTQLVGVIRTVADSIGGVGISEFMNTLFAAAFSDDFLLGMGATITYVLMVLQTFIFIIVYIKRFLVVLFLTIISPLIPLAYSIDRAKGGQARILNNWLKEYCYNVFIQIIHCVIYVVLIGVPLASLVADSSVSGLESLATSIILIFSMMFVKKAEELLKAIFGFDKSTSLSTYSSTINNMQNAVMTGVSVANGTYTVTHNNTTNQTTFGSNIQPLGQMVSNKVHEFKDKAVKYIDNYETKPLNDNIDGNSTGSRNKRDDVIDAQWEVVDDSRNAKGNTSDKNEVALPSGVPVEDASLYAGLLEAISTSSKNTSTKENGEELREEIETENNEHLVTEESSKTEEISRIEENSKTEEQVESDIPNNERDRHLESNYGSVIAIHPAMQRAIDEFKQEYTKTLDTAKINLKKCEDELQKAIAEKNQLALSIGNKRAKEIDKEVKSILEKHGTEEGMAFAKKLGGDEGRFAEACIKVMNAEKQKAQVIDVSADFMKHKLQNAVQNGVIDESAYRKLLDDYQNSLQGNESKSNEIINTSINKISNKVETEEVIESNKVTSEENITETEVVDLTDDLKLPKVILNSTIKSTRRPTINNSKILDILEGDITVDGDFSDSNLVDFNIKILEKAKHGAYSENNFKEAEKQVKAEGDLAVKRLERFKENQTAENAKNLTRAGKQYAQLMIESAQVGMFIVAAGMTEKQNVKENENTVDIKVNRGATMGRLQNDRTLNIIEQLNDRKKMA